MFVSCTSKANIVKIKRLQNKIFKKALNLGRLHSTKDLHKRAKTLLYNDRILYNQMKFIFVSLNKPELFHLRPTGTRTTRSSDPTTLKVEKPDILTFKNSFCYSGIVFWYALPTRIRNAASLSSFKTQLHKYFLEQY